MSVRCDSWRHGAAIAALVFITSSASAQLGMIRAGAKPAFISPGTVTTLLDTAEKLNARPNVAVGDGADWDNPSAGEYGRVTVTKLFTSEGMSCRSFDYRIAYRSGRPDAIYTTDWCKTADGNWKIHS